MIACMPGELRVFGAPGVTVQDRALSLARLEDGRRMWSPGHPEGARLVSDDADPCVGPLRNTGTQSPVGDRSQREFDFSCPAGHRRPGRAGGCVRAAAVQRVVHHLPATREPARDGRACFVASHSTA